MACLAHGAARACITVALCGFSNAENKQSVQATGTGFRTIGLEKCILN